jgi:hypothetical protein
MAYKLEQKLCLGTSSGKLWSEIQVKDTLTNDYVGVERKRINWNHSAETELSSTKIFCLVKGSSTLLKTDINSSGNYKIVTAILEDGVGNTIAQDSDNSNDAIPVPNV